MNKELLVSAGVISVAVHIGMILSGEFSLLFDGWLMVAEVVWSWLSLAVVFLIAYYLIRQIHHRTRPEVSE